MRRTIISFEQKVQTLFNDLDSFGSLPTETLHEQEMETTGMGTVIQRRDREGCVMLRNVIAILLNFLRLATFQPHENADNRGGRRHDD